MNKNVFVFDMEIIGNQKPVMFVCTKNIKTGARQTFWMHKKKDREDLFEEFDDKTNTFVSFNGQNFDQPLISMALWGHDIIDIKAMANRIIEERMMPWEVVQQAGIEMVKFDHIDLINVAPGVMISLKTYAGRIGCKQMMDMPFSHEKDLTPAEKKKAVEYCMNDLDVTEALLNTQTVELEMREQMSERYGVDLRSKSDAQIAEAILRHQVGIQRGDNKPPSVVTYKAPSFIKTSNKVINDLVSEIQDHYFKINYANGSVISPDFLEQPIMIGDGIYQVGVGGLHSQHDVQVYYEEDDEFEISDIDVASYYPNIMINAGFIPHLGGKGEKFIEEYRRIYEQRIEAKRSGNKKLSNSLKIVLNGTFGKLGNIYCSFYTPELMLAVTITGQLNLLCLIEQIEKIAHCNVISANTDGVMVRYRKDKRDDLFKKIATNAKRTGFEYEETRYAKVGLKDVNNYMAVTNEKVPVIVKPDGSIQEQKPQKVSVKAKGLYASNDPVENPLYLMKNPTMEVCSKLMRDHLINGKMDITKYTDPKDFVAIRNVKGGGVQHTKLKTVDDWIEDGDREWISPSTGKKAKRKSRPAPFEVGYGGIPFGRVARWYMTLKPTQPITYMSSGNKVPKTDGAMLCMTLPDKLPLDIDLTWYVEEAKSQLRDIGVSV